MTRKQIILEEKALERVIKEETGINEKVRSLSFDLSEKVMKEYDGSGVYQTTFIPFDDGEDYYTLHIRFDDYPKLSQGPEGGNAIYPGITYPSQKLVVVYGYTVRGRIIKEKLMEAIQHELHHVFEIMMAKKDGFFKKDSDRNIYITATNEARNKQLPEMRRYIGYALYLTNDFESRAFENGTYAYIMKQKLNFVGDEIKAANGSGFYQRLMYVREAYDFVMNKVEEATKIAESIYGKTYNWLKRKVTYALKECRRQYGRAIVKARKDYDWTHKGETLISV